MKGRKKSTISISTSIELVQIETDVFQTQSFALNLQILPLQIQRTPNELIKINLHQI